MTDIVEFLRAKIEELEVEVRRFRELAEWAKTRVSESDREVIDYALSITPEQIKEMKILVPYVFSDLLAEIESK